MKTDGRESNDISIDALYRAHRDRLLGLAAAITLDRHAAEEIVHDAFTGLHHNRAGVRDPVAYLQRSVVNRSVSLLRRRRTIARSPVRAERRDTTIEIDETWERVTSLPRRQRAVVVLRFWEDMSVEAIAETLGWPSGSVKSTLHRALARLREELSND